MVLDSKLGCEAYLVYPEVEITSDVKGEETKGRTSLMNEQDLKILCVALYYLYYTLLFL